MQPSRLAPPVSTDETVRACLPLVRSVVNHVGRRLPRHVDRDDLMSAGLEGLAHALRSYDPTRGTAFEVFARRRVRGAVLDELRRRDWAGRVVRAKTRAVQAAAADLTTRLGRRPSCEELVEAVRLPRAEVVTLLDHADRARRLERHVALGQPGTDVEGDAVGPEGHLLEDELRALVRDAVEELPARVRLAITGHIVDGREMRDLADELGVSASRVSQLCSEGVALLRDVIDAQLEPGAGGSDGPDATVTSLAARRRSRYMAAVAERRVAGRRAVARPAGRVVGQPPTTIA